MPGMTAGGWGQPTAGRLPAGLGGTRTLPPSLTGLGGDPYKEPITGTPTEFPLAGVSPESQYGAATGLKSQTQAEAARGALSGQESKQRIEETGASQAGSLKAQQEAEAAATAARTQQANLEQQAFQTRLGAIGTLGGTSAPGQVQYGGSAGGGGDIAAARAAAFARAKDQAGQVARSSLDALREMYAGSNLSGSGTELQREGQVISGGAGALGEVGREQALSDAAYAQHVGDVTYQGGIAQRGQDLQRFQSLLGLLQGGRGVY